MRHRWYRFFAAGFPTCCETHARHYFMVIYDVGEDLDTQFKLSLS